MYYIYRIKNKLYHKSYIGFTSDYEKRINQHKSELEKGTHICSEMQSDYNGISFYHCNYMEYEILAQCEDKEIAQDLEYLFIYKEIARKKEIYNKVQTRFPNSLLARNDEYANSLIDNRTLLHAYFNRQFGDVAFVKFCKMQNKTDLLELLEMN